MVVFGLSNNGTNCTISDNTCSGEGGEGGIGLSNSGTNCIISDNCSGRYDYALSNNGTDCTISGNICSGSFGLSNTSTNCTITGNTCSGEGKGLYCSATDTVNKCIIIGNICKAGGISVITGTCLPATITTTLRDPNDETKGYITAMEDVNTGVVTLRP